MIILTAAAALLAQPTATPAADPHAGHHATTATSAATPRWSIQTTLIADLMANPAAKAVVDRHLPGFSTHPMIGQAGRLTLKAVQGFTQGQITDAHLEAIERDLAALPAS